MVGTPRRTPLDTRRTPPDTAGQSDTPRTSNAGHTGHMSSDTSDTSDICPRYVLGHTFGHCPDTVRTLSDSIGHTGHIGQPGLSFPGAVLAAAACGHRYGCRKVPLMRGIPSSYLSHQPSMQRKVLKIVLRPILALPHRRLTFPEKVDHPKIPTDTHCSTRSSQL